MAVGQQVLGADVLDIAELDRIAACIEDEERDRSLRHARQLVNVLTLQRVYAAAGMGLSTAAYLALLLQCSETRAQALLSDARVLQRLGALDDMLLGLLTVEQSRVVVDVLGVLADDSSAASMWQRLRDRLVADQASSVVRPPARLRELLIRWVIAADPEAYAARRRAAAEIDADVELWKRNDGLADLAGRGLSAADAQACLDRIEELAQPTGPGDERSAGQRRRDAFRDVLLGRITLAEGPAPAGGCCPPGSAAPCGASIFVHVSLDAADGDPAELVGHGPIDNEALRNLMSAQPILHRVWTDRSGAPVAVDDRIWSPRPDARRLRQALTEIATGPPPDVRHRVHIDDAGSYVPPRRLKQPVRVRAPRCEWPGCGRRASRGTAAGCDLDHDLSWPFGPTCACNLGPLCRRHHRIKQLGWIKHRRSDGTVRWTSPDGRSWCSPPQHRLSSSSP